MKGCLTVSAILAIVWIFIIDYNYYFSFYYIITLPLLTARGGTRTPSRTKAQGSGFTKQRKLNGYKTTNLILLVQLDETGECVHGSDPGLSR